MSVYCVVILSILFVTNIQFTTAFHIGQPQQQQRYHRIGSSSSTIYDDRIKLRAITDAIVEPDIQNEPDINDTNTVESQQQSSQHDRIFQLQKELYDLGQRTNRGFTATNIDREYANTLIFDLAQYMNVTEPASTYYYNSNNNNNNNNIATGSDTNTTIPSLQGKWTLIYTDAPDIIGLNAPSPFVQLGQIGQDCTEPPYIKNVIEWKAPSWANTIPFLVGNNNNNQQSMDWSTNNNNQQQSSARILQKVVTSGTAVPESPTVVDLNVAGIQVSTPTMTTSSTSKSESTNPGGFISNLRESIEQNGLIVGLLQQRQKRQPNKQDVDVIRLDNTQFQLPFGSFEILYLDDKFRITKTNRNHYAVNIRIQPGDYECSK